MANFWRKWPRKTAQLLISLMNRIVFLFLDFLDSIMCIFYRFVDEILEGKSTPCYCQSQTNGCEDRHNGISGTLFGRKNVFREPGFLRIMPWKSADPSKKIVSEDLGKTRWSDCGCQYCVSWMNNGGNQKLHVVVQEPSKGNLEDVHELPPENVIFLHGFLSSSLLWTETVFPHLADSKYRLFAADLLGFGSSPKPGDCLYTLNDHVEMIEKSVIHEFKLASFHLVAHSMGCMIALALAAKYPQNLKSITLIAPVSSYVAAKCGLRVGIKRPYFSSPEEEDASLVALNRLAYKTICPPLKFGAAFMTWYEHLGRCVCFVVCRNHRAWERILKLVTRKRKLHFLVIDLTRHTHNSAWHTMHNVICGGAKMMDRCLETLKRAQARVVVVQGSRDQLVPMECSDNIKAKVPDAEVKIITNANHNTVILRREKDFATDLKLVWDSVKSNP